MVILLRERTETTTNPENESVQSQAGLLKQFGAVRWIDIAPAPEFFIRQDTFFPDNSTSVG
jgi:hypothetical protein